MKKSKLITALLLAVTMANFTIAATSCQNQAQSDNETTASSGATDSETVTTEAPENPEYVAPDVDYEGAEITFFVNNVESDYMISKYAGVSPEEENGDLINDAMFQRTSIVEEELNVNIESFIEDRSTASFQSSILAQDDHFKVGLIKMGQMQPLINNNGMLYDLNLIDTLDLERSWVDQDANYEYSIGSKQFAAVSDMNITTRVTLSTLFFNKKMIETYSLENPYQLVYDGKWTFEKLTEQSKACAKELNGDGIMDENDQYGISASATVVKMAIYSCGSRVTTKNAQNISELTLNTERVYNTIDKVIALLCDKNVNAYPSDFSAKAKNDVFYDIILPMFEDNRLLFNFNWVFYAMDLRNMDSDFGLLPIPKYDEAQDEYYSQTDPWWADLTVVPATVQNPDMIGDLLNAMGYYSQTIVMPEVIDRAVVTKTLRDDDSAKVIDILKDGLVFDLYFVYQWNNIINTASGCVDAGNNNFASTYAANETATINAIDKTFEDLM